MIAEAIFGLLIFAILAILGVLFIVAVAFTMVAG